MSKWFTSLILLIALAGGALAGMPLHNEHGDGAMADCCDKARSGEQSPEASAARLCCAFNCGDPAPTSSGLAFNFAPSIVAVTLSGSITPPVIKHCGSPVPDASTIFGRTNFVRFHQPKYIQFNSFLI